MKTSTTILVIFFAIIFLTPFLIAFALTSKLKSGAYTVVKTGVNEANRNFKVANFKVVKIKSNFSELRCSIIKDDSSFVSYPNWSNDSVSLSNIGDTLVVSHNRPNMNDESFHINIHGTDPTSILADNASILIFPHTFFADHPLNVELKNGAGLRFLSSATKYIEDDEDGEQDTTVNRVRFNKIAISADASAVQLPAFIQVDALTFKLHNKSKLLFTAGLKYGQLSGSVSDDSEVQAPWRIVKELKSVAE